ncbi:hypothetical protein GCM10019994_30700 [Enterococcus raffinosus]|nr:hypothetical protein NUITMVRE36_24480 [Enterococcus raffinosus]
MGAKIVFKVSGEKIIRNFFLLIIQRLFSTLKETNLSKMRNEYEKNRDCWSGTLWVNCIGPIN